MDTPRPDPSEPETDGNPGGEPTPSPAPPPREGPWKRLKLHAPVDEPAPDPAGDQPPPPEPPRHFQTIPREQRPRAAAILVGVILVSLFAWLSWALPIGRALEPLKTPAFVFLDSTGKPFARKGFVKDEPVRAQDLPAHVKQAFISIEDRRFYSHWGVDARAVARALRNNRRAGEVVEGGSTITQQLAKTAFLDSRQTLRRKAQEALIALWLETRLSKDEILSRYLSAVYFGDGVYGLRSAAKHYFGKEPDKLDVREAAMLAGLLKAPSRLAPTSNRRGAVERYRVVLGAMVETGAITEADARRYRRNPPRVTASARDLPSGHWFSDWIAADAVDAAPSIYGALQVRTTLDPALQRRAERTLRRMLANSGGGASQGALVAMRPDGQVVALVGGRDYRRSSFNRVTQARRQPGSAFKLFVWAAALNAGLKPDSLVLDTPLKIGDWEPRNSGESYTGNISLTDALAKSSNVAAVRLATRVGPQRVIKAARDMGVTTPLDPVPALALGVEEMTLMELTAAYASVASGQEPVRPWGLADARPRVRQKPLPHARDLQLMLRAAAERGTGRASGAEFGKTGTTSNNRDAVFVGYADGLVVGVWVGNDNGTPMRGVSGGGLPASIFREFTGSQAHQAEPEPEVYDPYAEDPYALDPDGYGAPMGPDGVPYPGGDAPNIEDPNFPYAAEGPPDRDQGRDPRRDTGRDTEFDPYADRPRRPQPPDGPIDPEYEMLDKRGDEFIEPPAY